MLDTHKHSFVAKKQETSQFALGFLAFLTHYFFIVRIYKELSYGVAKIEAPFCKKILELCSF